MPVLSVDPTYIYQRASDDMPVTVAGAVACGKLFYLRNVLFGGKLALFTRNFGFNQHLKILNSHNWIWPETLPMVHLHVVPIVPMMGTLSNRYFRPHDAVHQTDGKDHSKLMESGLENFQGHYELRDSLAPLYLIDTTSPCRAGPCLSSCSFLPPLSVLVIFVLRGYQQNHTSEVPRARGLSIRPTPFPTENYLVHSGQLTFSPSLHISSTKVVTPSILGFSASQSFGKEFSPNPFSGSLTASIKKYSLLPLFSSFTFEL